MLLNRGRRRDRERRARELRLRLLADLAEPERCLVCGTDIERDFACCPGCGLALRQDCDRCGERVHVAWAACPYCGDGAGVTASAA